jgi:cyclohexanecarboxylate-CoA ligase
MSDNVLERPATATRPPAPDDTLFASLHRSCGQGPATRRALAGVRNAESWVELSYGELLADIESVSTRLAELGLRRGDVLCMLLPNWTEAVIYTYAAARLGAVICPITTIYRQRELSFILERTACKVLVIPSVYRGFDYAAMVHGMAGDLPALRHVVCVGATDVDGFLPSEDLLRPVLGGSVTPPAGAADDVTVLAFTSGTTGEPKGVMHSAASLHAMIDDLVEHAAFGHGLTSLVISPIGHMTGFVWGVLMALRGAGDVVMLPTWEPERALDLVARYSVDIAMGATPFLSDLLDAAHARPGGQLPRIFICGGAPIPPSLIERAVREHGSHVVAVWGMSEYPVGTATATTDDPAVAATSDGRPCGRADVVIVDADGAPVPVGGEGDVIIRGPALFKGYYKRPDLEADSMTAEGYLRTGDRARLLDARGHMRISGRTKDIIIRGGENIPVVEIENLLLTHPTVKEIALVALPHERLGETACACLVVRPGAASPGVAELGSFLAEHGVAKQFFPEAVRVLPDLPRTPSGKIRKFALREQILTAATPAVPSGDERGD